MENKISVRLENSLKRFNVSLDECFELKERELKRIGFGNRSIIEINKLKDEKRTQT